MNPQLLDESLLVLQGEWNKQKYSPAQIDKIKQALLSEPAKALEAAFDYIILNFNGLPTPQKLIDAVRIEASKHRDSSWQKEKKEYQQPLVANTELARGAFKIIKQFYPDDDSFGHPQRVNYEKILADAQLMAISHPGSDWSNIYSDWKEQWITEGKFNRLAPIAE